LVPTLDEDEGSTTMNVNMGRGVECDRVHSGAASNKNVANGGESLFGEGREEKVVGEVVWC
jgi:hypothetical protein